MGAREAVSRVSYDSAQRETTRTLKASLMSPHRLPVVSTWYTMRFGCDGVSGDDEEGSGDEEEEWDEEDEGEGEDLVEEDDVGPTAELGEEFVGEGSDEEGH